MPVWRRAANRAIAASAWHAAPDWLRPLSYIFPLTYASDALKLTMLKGASLTDILYPDLFALLIFFILTFFMATFMIKKEIA
jgi:ABC-2 type transport system permease protein